MMKENEKLINEMNDRLEKEMKELDEKQHQLDMLGNTVKVCLPDGHKLELVEYDRDKNELFIGCEICLFSLTIPFDESNMIHNGKTIEEKLKEIKTHE